MRDSGNPTTTTDQSAPSCFADALLGRGGPPFGWTRKTLPLGPDPRSHPRSGLGLPTRLTAAPDCPPTGASCHGADRCRPSTGAHPSRCVCMNCCYCTIPTHDRLVLIGSGILWVDGPCASQLGQTGRDRSARGADQPSGLAPSFNCFVLSRFWSGVRVVGASLVENVRVSRFERRDRITILSRYRFSVS